MRIQQINDEDGGGELPGIFKLRRAGEGEHPAGFSVDGKVTIFVHGVKVKTAALKKISIEGLDDGFPEAGVLPAVVALVTGLPGGGSGGEVIPGHAGGELEEDVFEDQAVIEGRAAAGRGREERLEEEPLGVGD
jgi:hypothetical protein